MAAQVPSKTAGHSTSPPGMHDTADYAPHTQGFRTLRSCLCCSRLLEPRPRSKTHFSTLQKILNFTCWTQHTRDCKCFRTTSRPQAPLTRNRVQNCTFGFYFMLRLHLCSNQQSSRLCIPLPLHRLCSWFGSTGLWAQHHTPTRPTSYF
jgi:hypothetical protein